MKEKGTATTEQAGEAALAGYEVQYDVVYGGFLAYTPPLPISKPRERGEQIGAWWYRGEAWLGAWKHYQGVLEERIRPHGIDAED